MKGGIKVKIDFEKIKNKISETLSNATDVGKNVGETSIKIAKGATEKVDQTKEQLMKKWTRMGMDKLQLKT